VFGFSNGFIVFHNNAEIMRHIRQTYPGRRAIWSGCFSMFPHPRRHRLVLSGFVSCLHGIKYLPRINTSNFESPTTVPLGGLFLLTYIIRPVAFSPLLFHCLGQDFVARRESQDTKIPWEWSCIMVDRRIWLLESFKEGVDWEYGLHDGISCIEGLCGFDNAIT
jgi:hypothetical protein